MRRAPSKSGGKDTWRTVTWGERAEIFKEGIVSAIGNPRDWPTQHPEEWPVEFARAVAEELIRDVPNNGRHRLRRLFCWFSR